MRKSPKQRRPVKQRNQALVGVLAEQLERRALLGLCFRLCFVPGKLGAPD